MYICKFVRVLVVHVCMYIYIQEIFLDKYKYKVKKDKSMSVVEK